MNAQQKIEAAGRLSLQANKIFSSENRELLAYIADQDSFWKSIAAWIKLEARQEIAGAEPSVEVYLSILRRGFLNLLDEGTIELAQPISSLAQQALDQMRRQTGIGVVDLPASPAPAKTPQEALEDQVVADYTNLSSAAFMAKVQSNREYRATWQKLAETDRIVVRPQRTKSDEALEQEVVADYRSLPGKEFQAKRRSSAAYNQMYEKLCNESRISL